jgi:hypothetical protein
VIKPPSTSDERAFELLCHALLRIAQSRGRRISTQNAAELLRRHQRLDPALRELEEASRATDESRVSRPPLFRIRKATSGMPVEEGRAERRMGPEPHSSASNNETYVVALGWVVAFFGAAISVYETVWNTLGGRRQNIVVSIGIVLMAGGLITLWRNLRLKQSRILK